MWRVTRILTLDHYPEFSSNDDEAGSLLVAWTSCTGTNIQTNSGNPRLLEGYANSAKRGDAELRSMGANP